MSLDKTITTDCTLSWTEVLTHLMECEPGTGRITHCVIRGTDGDYGLAAVHRDGEVLVFDLGHKLIETGMAPDGPHLAQERSGDHPMRKPLMRGSR